MITITEKHYYFNSSSGMDCAREYTLGSFKTEDAALNFIAELPEIDHRDIFVDNVAV